MYLLTILALTILGSSRTLIDHTGQYHKRGTCFGVTECPVYGTAGNGPVPLVGIRCLILGQSGPPSPIHGHWHTPTPCANPTLSSHVPEPREQLHLKKEHNIYTVMSQQSTKTKLFTIKTV